VGDSRGVEGRGDKRYDKMDNVRLEG